MTNEEHDIILKLAKTIGPKYAFAYYTSEDMIAEAYILGLKAYPKWDKKRPLANFISTHMSNRLKTFRRDKYCRFDSDGNLTEAQRNKKNIVSPVGIDKAIDKTYVVNQDYLKEIDDIIPMIYRRDYLRMLAGVQISQSIKNKIIEICQKKLES